MAVSTSAGNVPADMSDFTGRFTAAWNACDTAAMAELVTEDIGWADPPLLSVSGDVAFWAWYMEGTHRGPIDPPGFAPTRRRMRVEGVDQWTMRDGRIARYRAFYDMNDLARQLGIVPAAGSTAERGMVALQRLQARLGRR